MRYYFLSLLVLATILAYSLAISIEETSYDEGVCMSYEKFADPTTIPSKFNPIIYSGLFQYGNVIKCVEDQR
uniref:Uncharacterized protein n=1 Tax=Acrobeloides nanus TaxID=290746 RepID=A0A914CLG4_9BILA